MTLEKLAQRHSVRSYSDQCLTDSEVSALKAAITAINSHEAGMHFKLMTDSPEAFHGFGRSYGIFSGVRNYIVLTVDSGTYEYTLEKAGYYAQMLVMKCVGMGLSTCFVGATFSRQHIDTPLRAGWQIPAVIAIGHQAPDGESFAARLSRRIIKLKTKAPLQFYAGRIDWDKAAEKFPHLLDALKAVALAPSALNRQPISITISPASGDTAASIDKYSREIMEVDAETRRFILTPISSVMHPALDFDNEYVIEASVAEAKQQIDLGIAMWNFEQLFPGYWIWGNPARFIPLYSEEMQPSGK